MALFCWWKYADRPRDPQATGGSSNGFFRSENYCYEVVVYRNGQECGADEIVTAGAAKRILAHADRITVPADASDICYVDICITDEDGRINPEANTAVSIRAEGCGFIQGFGSADPESEENYYDCVARAFGGRLRAAIRSNGSKGEILVTLSADGMEDAQVQILSE